jgi:hypothetical protein
VRPTSSAKAGRRDIRTWLRALDLKVHAAAFEENAIDDAVLPDLTDDDLKTLGSGAVSRVVVVSRRLRAGFRIEAASCRCRIRPSLGAGAEAGPRDSFLGPLRHRRPLRRAGGPRRGAIHSGWRLPPRMLLPEPSRAEVATLHYIPTNDV